MLKALIFDFDGLILDTETPEVLVWESIYREYGHELPLHEWKKIIGGYGLSTFDAAEHLAQLTQRQLDVSSLRARYRLEADRLIHASPIMPGVVDLIREAKQRGLGLAIASSSPHAWVDDHARRLGLFDQFDKIICAEDVDPGRTKPHPDLFYKALDQLKVHNNEAIVFEDSLNGVHSAKTAGIFVVAVPNPLTARLGVDGSDITLVSLAHFSLSDPILRHFYQP
jgi:putative hydrolase of the HAD superfamily